MPHEEVVRLTQRSEELKSLLSEFGLTLIGFDPGVLARHDDYAFSFDFQGHVWHWLEPLLVELSAYRAGERSQPDIDLQEL